MKSKILIAIIFLLLMTLISGCNNNVTKKGENRSENETYLETSANNETSGNADIISKGRYVEKKMEPPILDSNIEATIDMVINKSGNMEYFTYHVNAKTGELEDVYCYTYINGESEKETVNWMKSASLEVGMKPVGVCYGEDGNTYAILSKINVISLESGESSYETQSKLIRKNQDNYIDVTPTTWTDEQSPFIDDTGFNISTFCVTKSQVLCFKTTRDLRLYFYDLTLQQELVTEQMDTYDKFFINEDILYYIPLGSYEIVVKDLLTQKESSIRLEKSSTFTNLYVMDKNIYLIDNNGIHLYKNDATMWETIVDGSICSMGNTNYMVDRFVVCPRNNDFYVSYLSMSDYQPVLFASYVFDKNASLNFSKELSVYSLWDNQTLHEAIYDYMAEHTDTKINYVVATDDNMGTTLDDLIQALNSEILAGKGADIFLLDGLPAESYIQKGAMMDLSDIMKGWVNDGTINKNIASNYMINDKIYCMPIQFYIPLYYMHQDFTHTIESVEQLAHVSKKLTLPLFGAYDYDKIIYFLLTAYSNDLFNEDRTLNENNLKTFLTSIQTIGTQIGSKVKDTNINIQRFLQILKEKKKDILELKVMMSMGVATDIDDFITDKIWKEQKSCIYTSVNDTFIPNGLVGINKATKNEEVAKDFLEYLFSEDVQSNHLSLGFPVNQNALNSWGEEPLNENTIIATGYTDENGTLVTLFGTELTVEEKKEVINFVNTITTPIYNNSVVINMITDGTLSYLNGDKDLDQAIAEINDKVNLYIDE